jgi:hypothetical protein
MSEQGEETSMYVWIVIDPSLFRTGATGPRP